MAELIPVEAFDLIIFGGNGDLASRKLLPALFHRFCDGQITNDSRIIGVGREELDQAAFIGNLKQAFENHQSPWPSMKNSSPFLHSSTTCSSMRLIMAAGRNL